MELENEENIKGDTKNEGIEEEVAGIEENGENKVKQ